MISVIKYLKARWALIYMHNMLEEAKNNNILSEYKIDSYDYGSETLKYSIKFTVKTEEINTIIDFRNMREGLAMMEEKNILRYLVNSMLDPTQKFKNLKTLKLKGSKKSRDGFLYYICFIENKKEE